MNQIRTSEFKVIYLLGAGASANALPTVKGTRDMEGIFTSLRNFARYLKVHDKIDPSHKNFVDKTIGSLNRLANGSDKFGTPDTFVKFLYLKEKHNLSKLKDVLSFYFVYRQFTDRVVEHRALSFLTTVMQTGNSFPMNIKILTWNYDFQMQLASNVFSEEKFHITERIISTRHRY